MKDCLNYIFISFKVSDECMENINDEDNIDKDEENGNNEHSEEEDSEQESEEASLDESENSYAPNKVIALKD